MFPDFPCLTSESAASMERIAVFDLGERANSITAFASGILASGKPSFSAACTANTARLAPAGFANPISS